MIRGLLEELKIMNMGHMSSAGQRVEPVVSGSQPLVR